MTLVQMEYFQAVCRHMSFARAAQELHISQPAMSKAMKNLEEEVGVPLFIREKNALQITDEGHTLLSECELVLKRYDHMEEIISHLSLSRRFVRIGMSTLSGNQVFPTLVREYSRRYPDITIYPTEEATHTQFAMLDAGQLDLIITVRNPEEHPGGAEEFDSLYGHWPTIKSCQYYCVSRDHPLAGREHVTLEEISRYPLVMLTDKFSQPKRIRRMFEERGLTLNILHCTPQMYTVERFIIQGAAAGFLPQDVVATNPNIVGIPYDDSRKHPISIFWRRDHFLYEPVRSFLALAREMYPAK